MIKGVGQHVQLGLILFPTSVLFLVQLEQSIKINPTISSNAWDRGRSMLCYYTISGAFLPPGPGSPWSTLMQEAEEVSNTNSV